jgi:hypothetical protein
MHMTFSMMLKVLGTTVELAEVLGEMPGRRSPHAERPSLKTSMTETHNLRSRRFSKIAAGLGAAVVLGVAAACSPDMVSSPRAAAPLQMTASQIKLSDLAKLSGRVLSSEVALTRDNPLTDAIVTSATIGPNGGTIEVKDAGLKLTIPKNAIIGSPITITVMAVPGTVIAYQFEPHGTQFAAGLELEQDLKDTGWDKLKINSPLSGGYFKSLDQLNLQNGLSLLDEVLPVGVDKGKARFNIYHFSGYMVSTGRSGN